MFELFSDHPAHWQASELEQRPDWGQSWTAKELGEIDEAVRTSQDNVGPPAEAVAAALMGSETHGRMVRIQDSLENGCGAVWLQGFDPDPYSVEQLADFFTALASIVGTPISQTASGDRLFHVRDEGFGSQDNRTRGPNTNRRLSFHTDRCDVISFLCVHPAASGGENEIISSVALYNEIAQTRPDLMKVLMEPYLYQRHNVDHHHPEPYISQPIFSVHQGHFAANLLRVLIERAYSAEDTPEMTDLQREALDHLETVAGRPERHVRFRQRRGDILFLNNFVTFHRRTEFVDHEDPNRRRHLLRIWLSVPNSRPLDPRFAGNYGQTAAGALRGGMNPPS